MWLDQGGSSESNVRSLWICCPLKMGPVGLLIVWMWDRTEKGVKNDFRFSA